MEHGAWGRGRGSEGATESEGRDQRSYVGNQDKEEEKRKSWVR